MGGPPSLDFWKKKKKKTKETPKKARVLLFAEPLKSLEKEGKTHKKQGKSEGQGSRDFGTIETFGRSYRDPPLDLTPSEPSART